MNSPRRPHPKNRPRPLGAVAGAMVGVHLLIGLGEGLITAVTVGGVAAVRPDLVYGLHTARRPLEIRDPSPTQPAGA